MALSNILLEGLQPLLTVLEVAQQVNVVVQKVCIGVPSFDGIKASIRHWFSQSSSQRLFNSREHSMKRKTGSLGIAYKHLCSDTSLLCLHQWSWVGDPVMMAMASQFPSYECLRYLRQSRRGQPQLTRSRKTHKSPVAV